MPLYNSILDTIGRTPIVKLTRIGSVKDTTGRLTAEEGILTTALQVAARAPAFGARVAG